VIVIGLLSEPNMEPGGSGGPKPNIDCNFARSSSQVFASAFARAIADLEQSRLDPIVRRRGAWLEPTPWALPRRGPRWTQSGPDECSAACVGGSARPILPPPRRCPPRWDLRRGKTSARRSFRRPSRLLKKSTKKSLVFVCFA
jgi:hypothetical protein